MLLLQEHVADLAPLLARRIDTSRVVGAAMEEDDRFGWKGSEGMEQLFESKTDRFRVIIWVYEGLYANIPEDGKVVDCGRI